MNTLTKAFVPESLGDSVLSLISEYAGARCGRCNELMRFCSPTDGCFSLVCDCALPAYEERCYECQEWERAFDEEMEYEKEMEMEYEEMEYD